MDCQSFTRAYPIPKGLQVSRGVRTQAASEGHLRTGAPATGRDLPRAGPAKGMPDYRGTSDARPCAYVHRHSPPTPSSIGDRVSQRKECNRRRSPERQGAQFTGGHFWARGYAVSTVGFELEQVRTYIREQGAADGTAGQF